MMNSRRLVRAFASAAKASKLEKPYVAVDKAALSPIRSFFFGEIQGAATFPFPNVLTTDQKETLTGMLDPIQKFFSKVPSAQIDAEAKIPDDIMEGLKELGLFGLQIPEELNGLGLSNTGYARVVEELVWDPSIAVTLMAHQSIGLKGILLVGTEEQKQKYLPKLATGEHIAAFALTEPSTGSDAASIKLSATPTPDGKGFLLNGQKMWISNGGIAQIYTVFARTPGPTPDAPSKITAFIVDKAFGGITPGPPEKKLGIKGSNTCVVSFEDCFVPMENVLGEVGGGFKVAMSILNNGRFGMGCATASGIRKLIQGAAEYANARIQFTLPISRFGLIREKFARMAADAYAIESMGYMTTALIDQGKDASMEAAAVKIYGSDAMFKAIDECIQILGGQGFASGGVYPFERLLRDSRILRIFEGTNEILSLLISLTCLQGAGAELKHLMSNPVGNAGQLLPMLLRTRLGMGLPALPPVAPALATEAAAFPAAVASFQAGIHEVLRRHGKSILEPDNQLVLRRISDAAIDLYGWQCVLSRATSALQGPAKVEHPEYEAKVAKLWIAGARQRIAAAVKGMKGSPAENGDAATLEVAKMTVEAGRYLAEHPLRI